MFHEINPALDMSTEVKPDIGGRATSKPIIQTVVIEKCTEYDTK